MTILPRYEGGKPSKRARAIYSTIDPRADVPNSYADAAKMEAAVRGKMWFGDPDKMSYDVGDTPGEKVADAAWRKRLGFDYDKTLLPDYNGGVRLPIELEKEIPTDTTMLKNRIAATKKLMDYSRKYRDNKYIKLAKQVDEEALEALRHTYKTGQPAVINEHSFNSRQWVSGGRVDAGMSPLNVLGNYTIQYNPKTNSIDYRDIYDFNKFDWAVPGNPYNISGSILLPRK